MQEEQFHVHDLGMIDYEFAYEAQKSIHETVVEGEPSTIILCEHPTIITQGRLTKAENIIASEHIINENNVKIINIDRGGDVTLHAPGQLVIYVIFDLNKFVKDLHRFLHQLEEVTINILADFEIVATRHPQHTGVWVGSKKIASMGVGVKKWVTYHGIGLNVNTDLSLFNLINPCGISAVMTSMQEQKGQIIEIDKVKEKVLGHFNQVFRKC